MREEVEEDPSAEDEAAEEGHREVEVASVQVVGAAEAEVVFQGVGVAALHPEEEEVLEVGSLGAVVDTFCVIFVGVSVYLYGTVATRGCY